MAKGIFLHFTNDTYLFYLRWHFAGILSIESGDGWCNIFGVTQAIGIIAKIFNSIIIIVPCQPMLLAPLFFVTQQPNVLIRKNTIVICSFPIGCIWLCLFASHFFFQCRGYLPAKFLRSAECNANIAEQKVNNTLKSAYGLCA